MISVNLLLTKVITYQLSDATGIPSSTLGNYEKDENIDMSLSNLITLANFYNVSIDYLLCRTELRKHKNLLVSDLHLNDDAIQILTDKNITLDYYLNYSHMKISKNS
ncbi:helix-turn-helix domain-containing protein [Anaerostipes sp.]|uniref:helix-turn-helix domain-containing protein n=1 Tax=Anaerostipes sp. TaxID=1872530 RepID=UPI003FA48487